MANDKFFKPDNKISPNSFSEQRKVLNSVHQGFRGHEFDKYIEGLVPTGVDINWLESVLDFSIQAAGIQVVGNRYIASAAGVDWVKDRIYEWNGLAWDETIPSTDDAMFCQDIDVSGDQGLWVWNGTAWVQIGNITEAGISHLNISNIGVNTHAQIDIHVADATIHFTEANINHTAIQNIGVNTHVQIDNHIADGTIHFANLAGFNTDDLAEGLANLYFTNARAITALTGQNISIFVNDSAYITQGDIDWATNVPLNETDPVYAAWIAGPPNISEFTNDSGYITGADVPANETDPVFTAWLAVPPNISIFTNDSGYLTSATALWDRSGTLLTTNTSGDDVAIGGSLAIGIETAVNLALQITGATDATTTVGFSRHSDDDDGTGLFFVKSRGTYAVPTAILSGDDIGSMTWLGYGATGYAGGAIINVEATENWTDAATGAQMKFSTIETGTTTSHTTTLTNRGHLHILGNISSASLFGIDMDKSLVIRSSQIQDGFAIETDSNGVLGPVIDLLHNSASPAVGDEVGRWRVLGKNDAGDYRIYGQMNVKIVTATDGSTDGQFKIEIERGGGLARALDLNMGVATQMVVSDYPFGTDDRNAYFQAKRITEGHGFDTYLKSADGIAGVSADYDGGDIYIRPGVGVGTGITGSTFIGGAANYSKFEGNGFLEFDGDARAYDDLQFPISNAKVPASNFPNWETFTTNTKEYSFAVDDYIDTQANELPHWWEEGTTGHVHLHITTKAANATGADRFAKFTVWVGYSDVDEVWVETSFTAEYTIPTGTLALTHLYLDMGNLTLTNYLIGAEVKCRIKRIAATGGTEYTGNIFITQTGIHLEKDTVGSRTELVK